MPNVYIEARPRGRPELAPGAAIGCTVDQRGHLVPTNRGTRIVPRSAGRRRADDPATKINAEKPQSSRPKLQAVSAPLYL